MIMATSNEGEKQTKNLLMRAWRERWTHVQWGIHVKQLTDDERAIADCILQQALIGPGPNTLVMSYLVHSVFSQIVSTASVLRSVSKYDGYHKPFCIMSLLELLDTLKERLMVGNDCHELAMSIQATVHWLLACMYSSLEKLSDQTNSEDSTATTEDSRIVGKCRKLIGFLFTDTYIAALLQIANADDPVTLEKIKNMCREVGKFSDGPHKEDIAHVTTLINQSKDISFKLEQATTTSPVEITSINGAIQSTIMRAALLKSSSDIPAIVSDLVSIKELKNMSAPDLICDVIHSTMIGLIDAIGSESEVRFLGFTFLQLPSLFGVLKEHLNDPADLVTGIDLFISNESTLDVIDVKLHAGECSTLELFLSALSKNSLITKEQMTTILSRKGGNANNGSSQTKPNSSNAMLLLKAETTLLSVLKTLDGDYSKNQDAILGVLSEMFKATKSFELILTASSATGRLQQVISRLLKLNQASRMVTGEGNKASATRALIFDISFLSLCYIVQHFGINSLDFDSSSSFFTEWARECLVEGTTAKSPDRILARCDQTKVDNLLNTYLQTNGSNGDPAELKTSLVFWHELATNAVGVVRELLLAWENSAISIGEVKRILDTLRSKVCAVPVSVATWLCSHIQIMREEDCGKARYILNHFLTPLTTPQPTTEDNADNFKERCAMMNSVISRMMISIQSSPTPTSNTNSSQICISETRPTLELLSPCWETLGKKGRLDVETTLALNRILTLGPPTLFVQLAIQELFNIQHSQDLLQWSDITYGVLHFDLESCATALFSSVLPNLLLFSSKLEFVEPQLTALVSLSVEIALSLHLHCKAAVKVKEEGSEPAAKRRKITTSETSTTTIKVLLTQLYSTFGSVLAQKGEESRPQAIFILRFLEQLASRDSTLIIGLLSHKTVFHLLRLLGTQISPSLLPSLFSLGNSLGRKACSEALLFLKNNHNSTGNEAY